MISVFDEAGRDVEKEELTRKVAVARSMVNSSLIPFVSAAQNEEQYAQYKAIVRDSIDKIASQCGLAYDEIERTMDSQMKYVLEARQAAFSDKERFYIIDGRGKRIGGSYSSREAAQEAIRRGEVKAATGLKVIPRSAFQATSSKDQEAAPAPQNASEGRMDPFKALASLREALQEGVNPLDWVTDEGGVTVKEGTPSEHNDSPSPQSGTTASVTIQLTEAAKKMMEKAAVTSTPPIPEPGDAQRLTPPEPNTMHQNAPTPEVDTRGGVPTTSPSEQTRVMPNNPLGPSMAKIQEEISRYNPHLSPERVQSIAVKVASKFFADQEDED